MSEARHKRILIAGAGAIGSVVGAILEESGSRVTLLGRTPHLAAISQSGLSVTGLLGDHHVSGFDLADRAELLDGKYDLILCTVKSYDTAAIAEAIKNRLAPDGVVISMQNGLGNIELLGERFSLGRVLGARVIFGAEIVSPGSAHVTVFADPVAIGPDPQLHQEHTGALAARAGEIAALLDTSGVPAVGCADIMPIIWSKLLYNIALNPLGAIYECNYGCLAADPELHAIMDDLIEEGFGVARRVGVEMSYRNANEYRDAFYGKMIPATASHYPTMLHDLQSRGRTDIDALNGKVVELARLSGLAAPVNATMVRMIHGAQRMRGAKLDLEPEPK